MKTDFPFKIYSPEEVATMLGVSTWWIRQRVREGRFAHQRGPYGSPRFTEAQIQAIIDSMEIQAVPESGPAIARRPSLVLERH